MTDEEREIVIKSNIPSCLFNAFLGHVLNPDLRFYINESLVTLKIIREYIKTQSRPDPGEAIKREFLRIFFSW